MSGPACPYLCAHKTHTHAVTDTVLARRRCTPASARRAQCNARILGAPRRPPQPPSPRARGCHSTGTHPLRRRTNASSGTRGTAARLRRRGARASDARRAARRRPPPTAAHTRRSARDLNLRNDALRDPRRHTALERSHKIGVHLDGGSPLEERLIVGPTARLTAREHAPPCRSPLNTPRNVFHVLVPLRVLVPLHTHSRSVPLSQVRPFGTQWEGHRGHAHTAGPAAPHPAPSRSLPSSAVGRHTRLRRCLRTDEMT